MRRCERTSYLVAAIIAIGGAGSAGLLAADHDPAQRLEHIQRTIDAEHEHQQRLAREAEMLAKELAELRARSIAAAAKLQDQEDQIAALAAELARLDADVAARHADLQRRRSEFVRLLAALTRLGRQPVEAVLVLPGSPVDAARTAKLLGTAAPAVEAEAAALRQEIEALVAIRGAAAQHRQHASQAAARLAADRSRLDDLIRRRASLYRETESAQRSTAGRLEALSREAQNLRELIERLAAERIAREARERSAPAPGPTAALQLRPFSEARGQVLAPARGRVVTSFGQPGESGQPHRGLTIETQAEAQIVAPYDGQIAFAGPFRAYGLILIIEHSEGYHTLLAGLGRIDSAAGQWVAAGEPVGVSGVSDTGNPTIYVELRRNGQPINPLPWLVSRNEKVSG